MLSPRIWIALTRPDNLVTALVIARLARDRFASCHLIHERSSWWDQADWAAYQKLFSSVHATAKIRQVRGIFDAARYVREVRARQAALTALGIAPHDTIMILSSTTNLANALASAYPRTAKVLCLPAKFYVDASLPANSAGYRRTTSGWLQGRILERLGGIGRTVRLRRRRIGGDGARIERLEKNLEEVFDALLLLSNGGTAPPPGAGPRVVGARFPTRDDLSALIPPEGSHDAEGPGRDVIFFGTPFLLVRNLDPRQYAAILNGCLEYLRRHYGGRCRLIYRPHPAETSERRLLHLRGFVAQVDLEVAELYLLRKLRRIEAVFSVASTVSRVAYNYGLDGYAFWRCFPFVSPASEFFETLLGQVPAAFDIATLDSPPVPYAEGLAGKANGVDFAGGVAQAWAVAAAGRLASREKGFAPAEDSPV